MKSFHPPSNSVLGYPRVTTIDFRLSGAAIRSAATATHLLHKFAAELLSKPELLLHSAIQLIASGCIRNSVTRTYRKAKPPLFILSSIWIVLLLPAPSTATINHQSNTQPRSTKQLDNQLEYSGHLSQSKQSDDESLDDEDDEDLEETETESSKSKKERIKREQKEKTMKTIDAVHGIFKLFMQ